jgi:hypothetical protein
VHQAHVEIALLHDSEIQTRGSVVDGSATGGACVKADDAVFIGTEVSYTGLVIGHGRSADGVLGIDAVDRRQTGGQKHITRLDSAARRSRR